MHGSETMPSIGILFVLAPTKSEIQPQVQKELQLTGQYVNDDEEVTKIKLTVKGQDASGNLLSETSSGLEIGTGRKFRVGAEVLKADWVPIRQPTSKTSSLSHQRAPFTITDLIIDPQSGDIESAQATVDGTPAQFDLQPVVKQHS